MGCLLVLLEHLLVLPIIAFRAGNHGKEELAVVTVLASSGNEPATADFYVIFRIFICCCKVEAAITCILQNQILIFVIDIRSINKRCPVAIDEEIY